MCIFLRLQSKPVLQTSALDYGPQGNADVTANIMEAVPCGPILHENAEPDAGYPLLRVEQPYSDPDSELCRKVWIPHRFR